jgi:hypothetical protein
LIGQEFGRALADPLGALAPQEMMVVEEELEQGQVIGPQMAAEEEVAAQPAVEVLKDGTDTDRLVDQFGDGHADHKEARTELLAQGGLAGANARDPADPTPRG